MPHSIAGDHVSTKVTAHRENRSEGGTAWKEALHESFFRSEQPLKAIAAAVGVSTSYLGHAADVEQPDAHVSGRLFPLLAAQCSNLAFLDYLEQCAGRVAVRVPSGSGVAARALGALARETGEAMTRVADVLEDGRVTSAELAAAVEELNDVIRAAASLRETLARHARQDALVHQG